MHKAHWIVIGPNVSAHMSHNGDVNRVRISGVTADTVATPAAISTALRQVARYFAAEGVDVTGPWTDSAGPYIDVIEAPIVLRWQP